jgi:hypothetical protein
VRRENQALAGTSARAAGESRGPRLSQLWAIACVALPLAVLSAGPLVAVDLAYHIRAGEMMLDSHRVLRADPLLPLDARASVAKPAVGRPALLDFAHGWPAGSASPPCEPCWMASP